MSLKSFYNAALWIALAALAIVAWVFNDVYTWLWSGV